MRLSTLMRSVLAFPPPSNLTYGTNPASYTNGVAISTNSPTVTGIVDSYSVSPSLPTGLSLNTTTGAITGTPSAVTAVATYTVTATNTAGYTTCGVSITVAAFTAANLPSLWAWYDATQDTVVADTTILTGWTDRSGSGRNMTDATSVSANYQGPKYRTNVFGSKPALQGWTSGADRGLLRYHGPLPTDTTWYIVMKTTTGAATKGMIQTEFDGTVPQYGAPHMIIQNNSGTTWKAYAEPSYHTIGSLSDNTGYIMRIEWRNTASDNVKVYINNSLVLNESKGTAGSKEWIWFFTGYNGNFTGHIAEVAISNTLDSAGNQTLMETALNAKWSVY